MTEGKLKPKPKSMEPDEFTPGPNFMQSLEDFKARKRINTKKNKGGLYKDNTSMQESNIGEDYKLIRKIEAFILALKQDNELKHKKDRIEKAEKQLKEIIQKYKETSGIVNTAEKLLAILEKNV